MNKKVILKERKVFEEDNHLYLKLVYEYENERGVYELIIPKLDLEIRTDCPPTISHDYCAGPMDNLNYYIDRYSDRFILLRDDVAVRKNGVTLECENAAYVTNTLKEKPKEMTIAEIEKKLGYKVKLVSGTGDDSTEKGN